MVIALLLDLQLSYTTVDLSVNETDALAFHISFKKSVHLCKFHAKIYKELNKMVFI